MKFQIAPTIVIIPYRLDDFLTTTPLEGQSVDDAINAAPYTTQIRPASEFKYENGRTKLLNLRIEEIGGPTITMRSAAGEFALDEGLGEEGGDREARIMRLGSYLNVDSRVSVGCAGALLTYLQRRKAMDSLPGDGNGEGVFVVERIEIVSLKETMLVDANTIVSLQIFEDESHPNFHMQGRGGQGNKEGLSLFGIMNHTKTYQGHILLKQWFLRPLLDIREIEERQESIACFTRADNQHVVEGIQKSLKKIKNIPKIMTQLKSGKSEVGTRGNWNSLLQFALNALRIRTAMLELNRASDLRIYKKVSFPSSYRLRFTTNITRSLL